MFRLGRTCCNGVRWKQSIQNFERHLFSGTAARRKQVLTGKCKPKNFTHFKLSERGKTREIDAPHVHDRQIQKVLTRKVLLPCYQPLLIYNNGASLKGKGLDFAKRELKRDLSNHFRRYGLSGYIIITDFSGFFPNANHEYIKSQHKSIKIDNKICALFDGILDKFDGGVPLGVEPSQVEMINYPSKLDNYVACQLGLKGFGHYMDDYYLLIPPELNLKEILNKLKAKALENKLIINDRKTKIIKFGQPFRFCKSKYCVTETGRIVVHGGRDAIKRACGKLQKLQAKFQRGEVSALDIWTIVQACRNYYSKSNDYGRLLRLRRKAFELYGGNLNGVHYAYKI